MKFRRHKVKREHGIIQDALSWLEDLGSNSEVSDIIPGVIEVSRSPEKGIVYKYETKTGCKLLLKSNGSIQEAFVVTKEPNWVRKWVDEHFPSPSVEEVKVQTKTMKPIEEVCVINSLNNEKPRITHPSVQPENQKGKAKRINKSNFSQNSWTTLSELDDISLGERLDKNILQALKALQMDLNKSTAQKTSLESTVKVKANCKKKNKH